MDAAKDKTNRMAAGIAILLFLGSATAFAVAPAGLPADYSWVMHTTSEAGAQAVNGAWTARLGFVLFGLGVVWIASRSPATWGPPATGLHLLFGCCMLAVAAFSTRPWFPTTDYDPVEDALHSRGATIMGFAFAFGVAAVAVDRLRQSLRMRVLDVVAVLAATVLPLLMVAADDLAGLLQRVMFGVAYLWYGREAWESRAAKPPPAPQATAHRSVDASGTAAQSPADGT